MDARARAWAAHGARARTFEGQWVRAFRRLFDRQARSAVSRLEGRSRAARFRAAAQARTWGLEDRAPADEVFDPAHWHEETADLARTLYEAVASGSLSRLSDQLGISFDLANELVADFIEQRANQLSSYVTDTTYAALQDALNEGVAAGEGIPDLAARIRAVFEEASTTRAEVIARTEVVSASNGAALEGARACCRVG